MEECKNQMKAGHLRTSEFFANAALFHCVSIQSSEMDGAAGGRGNKTMGSKDDEAVVNSCCRKIDAEWSAMGFKIAGKIPSSGRMARVGAYVIEC